MVVLLDQQPARHKLLYDQVEQLTERGTSNPIVLNQEQQKLSDLHAKSNGYFFLYFCLYRQFASLKSIITWGCINKL